MAKLRARLTYANVMATIAMFLALGGGVYAATQLPRNSVKSKHIKNGQVRNKDLRDGAVTKAKLATALRPLTFETDLAIDSLTDELLDEQGFRVIARCDDVSGEPELVGSIKFPEDGTVDLFSGESVGNDPIEGAAGRVAVPADDPLSIQTGPPTATEVDALGSFATWLGSTRSALITIHTVANDDTNRCSLAGAIVPLS